VSYAASRGILASIRRNIRWLQVPATNPTKPDAAANRCGGVVWGTGHALRRQLANQFGPAAGPVFRLDDNPIEQAAVLISLGRVLCSAKRAQRISRMARFA
jgi:hypothetical protein